MKNLILFAIFLSFGALADAPVSLKILSPKPGEVTPTNDVAVQFELKNYDIKPGGQHIHVILDNEPYQPDYDIKAPFMLKNLKPGHHTIRAFPARAWHESIKDPSAFASVDFYVLKKEGDEKVNFKKDPVLTYSRPKGKYEGDQAKKIIFDFWVKNAKLSDHGYKVRYQLDDQKPEILTKWEPQYFDNLSAGKHQLKLELLDKKGNVVPGPFNITEREFEVAP